jgi:uncharacterized protein (DUF4415 family)
MSRKIAKKMISLRIEPNILEKFQEIAKKKNIGYQSLIRILIKGEILRNDNDAEVENERFN